MLAMEFGSMDMLVYFLKLGASVNVADAKKNTLMHWAAKFGRDDFCELLAAEKKMLAINTRNEVSK